MREWWDQVYVVSVRRGFRQVTLGRWGNGEGVFGGFTTAPEDYQIRRLLRVKDGVALTRLEAATQTDSWELIDEVPKRTYLRYPEKMVPTEARDSRVTGYFFSGRDITILPGKEEFLTYQLNRLADGRMNIEDPLGTTEYSDRFYLKFLPPSSFTHPAQFLPRPAPLNIQQYTGFRCLNEATVTSTNGLIYHVRYHHGIDIGTGGAAAGTLLFKAPESGVFYTGENGADEVNQVVVKAVGSVSNAEDVVSSYSFAAYGNIGVLFTNPESPRDGRVYVFCHMEENAATGAMWNERQTFYQNAGFEKTYPQETDATTFPLGRKNAISVTAGEEIGHIGDDGEGPTHIHLEIWEYFEQIDGKSGGGWRRVDPLSVFYGKDNDNKWVDLNRGIGTTDGSDKIQVYFNSEYKTIITTVNDDNNQPEEVKPELYRKVFNSWFLWRYYPDTFFTAK